jgi:hypothetical protein
MELETQINTVELEPFKRLVADDIRKVARSSDDAR